MSASAPSQPPASQTVFSIGYDFHLGNSNNGNVYGITNYKDPNRNQTFTYDPLSRLISAQNAGTNCAAMTVNGKTQYWGNNYTYDAWGNLYQKNVTKCGAENLGTTILNTNRIGTAGYGYDAAGNMTANATDAVNATFDAESRISTATKSGVTTTYVYDSDGNRVKKTNGSINDTLYWYMTPGIVAESDLSGATKSEYIFFAGERVARRDGVNGTGGVFYYFSDHLKTASVITDATGTIKAESDYYPWGGELQFVNADSNHYKFTGKERDSETGLDYFGARYYSNGLARWTSADWSNTPTPVPYASFGNPQSLGLFRFSDNNPSTFFDLNGHLLGGIGDFFRRVFSSSPKDPDNDDTNTASGPIVNSQEAVQRAVKDAGDALNAVASTAELVDPTGVLSIGRALAEQNHAEAAIYVGLLFIPGATKTNEAVHVYQIVKDGKVIYVGITNSVKRRAVEHGVPKLDKIVTLSSRDQARAVEQALIQHHGLEKNGGTLKNKINSISPKRSGFAEAVASGYLMLRSVGYPF